LNVSTKQITRTINGQPTGTIPFHIINETELLEKKICIISLNQKLLKLSNTIFPEDVKNAIIEKLKGDRKISFLVGAGISAESGIPTFRDKDGFWTSGSKNYTPQEIGTKKMFDINSNEVWRWFLYRISLVRNAKPNLGHIELSKIEKLLPSRFNLISQNVDGLHFKPESYIDNVFLIHGDLRYMRCSEECTRQLFQIPAALTNQKRTRETPITFEETELLKCPNCSSEARPHVLWFDEYYNEHQYHLHKVLRIAKSTGILFVIGTSGATNLPQMVVDNTLKRQGIVVDINPNKNLFSDRLENLKNGYSVKSTSSVALKELRELIAQFS